MILRVGGILCALILLYALYQYGWTASRRFTNPIASLLYFGVPAGMAGLMFAALRLKPSRKIGLVMFLVATVFSIHLVNLVLAVFHVKLTNSNSTLWFRSGDIEEVVRVAKELGVPFDSRPKIEVVTDLRRKGINAVPAIIPLALLARQPDGTRRSMIAIGGKEVLPHGGISNRVTVYCNESGEYVIYESDEHGFHNPKGVWGAGSVDIMAAGDSFTQGGCVPSGKNFVDVIRQQYAKSLNLGMAGQGPLITLATIKDYAKVLKPKIILWFFYEGNDIGDLSYERTSPLLMRYLEDDFRQDLLYRQADVDKAIENYIQVEQSLITNPSRPGTDTAEIIDKTVRFSGQLARLSQLRQRLGLVYGDYRANSHTGPDTTTRTDLDLLQRILAEAKASADSVGARLHFVYLPERERYSEPTNALAIREQVLLSVKRAGIPLIDIHDAFRVQKDPLALFPLRRMGHYNELGHQVVGETVVRNISFAPNTASDK